MTVEREGADPEEVAADVNAGLYARLESAARARQFVFYDELGEELGLRLDDPQVRAELWEALSDITRREVAAGRPMLASICVQQQDHLPGRAFFQLGDELGLVGPDEDEVTFAVRQIAATHDYWSDLAPFGARGETA